MRKTAGESPRVDRRQHLALERALSQQIPQGMTVDDTFIMVHGSLVERDAYILSAQEISKNLNCMINDFPGMKICFFGHTHIPMLVGTKAVISDLR